MEKGQIGEKPLSILYSHRKFKIQWKRRQNLSGSNHIIYPNYLNADPLKFLYAGVTASLPTMASVSEGDETVQVCAELLGPVVSGGSMTTLPIYVTLNTLPGRTCDVTAGICRLCLPVYRLST